MIRVFNHYVPATMVLLLISEICVLLLSIYFGVWIRFSDISLSNPSLSQPLLPTASVFSIVILLIMTSFGLYELEFREGLRGMIPRLSASFAIGFAIMSLIFYLVPSMMLGRGALGIAFLMAFSGTVLIRFIFFKTASFKVLRPRVLVLGSGSRASKVEAILKTGKRRDGLHIVGYLPLNGRHHYVDHSRILPDKGNIASIIEKYRVDEVVIAVRDRRGGGLPVNDLLECKLKGVNIIELSTFYERETGQLQLESLNATWMILSEGFRQGRMRDIVKRTFDLFVSTLLLAAASPIMLITAILIRLDSPGPILYRQERVGQGGKVFTILKFRSMVHNAEDAGQPKWAQVNDVRTTRIGKLIRKLRIDELPQIFNVFMGDMSFVGPRPERPYFVEQLSAQIPFYSTRHSVKPGITGWAQVRYSYGASLEDAIAKLQYDLYYVKNHSLFLDLMMLIETAQVVLWGKGAR